VISKFHEITEQKEVSDADYSIGSISSADEKDMDLLFSGDHTYQF